MQQVTWNDADQCWVITYREFAGNLVDRRSSLIDSPATPARPPPPAAIGALGTSPQSPARGVPSSAPPLHSTSPPPDLTRNMSKVGLGSPPGVLSRRGSIASAPLPGGGDGAPKLGRRMSMKASIGQPPISFSSNMHGP